MIYVECKRDRTLVQRLTGLGKKQITHDNKNKSGIRRQLSKQNGSKRLVDQNPGSPQPSYIHTLVLSRDIEQHGLKVYLRCATEQLGSDVVPEVRGMDLRSRLRGRPRLA